MRALSTIRRRANVRAAVLVLAAVTASVVVACDVNKLASPKAGTEADSLKVAIARDTALVINAKSTLKVTPSVGTLSQLAVRWSSSAPQVASVDSITGVVSGIAIGSAVITAKAYAPELTSAATDTLTVKVKYGGISIKPLDSLTSIGQKVALDVRGTDAAGAPVASIAPIVSSKAQIGFLTRDATIADVDTAGNVIAVKNGSGVRIVATYQGFKDSTLVKVRQVAKSITFPAAVSSEVPIQSLNVARPIAVVAKDGLGAAIAAPVVTWTTSDATVVSIVAATGVATGVKLGTATLTATVDGLAQTVVARVTQLPFKIDKTAGDAQSAVAGTAVAVLPKVTVLDSGLTPIPGVAVTFAAGTGSGSITGGSQVTSASGQANVGSWILGTTAGTNSLTATSLGVTGTFTATGTPGVPAAVAFSVSPSATGVNSVIAPSVKVTVVDAAGNPVTTATNSITLALVSGSGTLGGTLTAAAVAGVATFNNLTISASGTFKLGASATGLTSATSDVFTIFGPAAKLAFTVQPTSVSATAPIAPAIKVTIQDASGATVLNSTASVTLAIGTNPSSGTLGGTLTVPAVAGVATFPNVSVSAIGNGYTLTASSTSLAGATSNPFNITAVGPAATLVFLTQPANVTAGVAMAPFTVGVTDASGALITTENSRVVTISLPGVAIASGTTSQTVVNGVATFNNIVINRAGTGYALSATAALLTNVPAGGVSSATFNVAPAAVTKIGFAVSPSSAEVGGAIAPAVQVGQQDAFGNVVTTAAPASVTVALTPGTGAAGAALTGTATATTTAGVATFNNLAVSLVGTGYTLTATSGALPSVVSASFNVVSTGTPVRLAFLAPPVGGQAGAAMTQVKVAIQLADGTTATTVAPTVVTLAFLANPGGAVLTGAQATTANGVATFSTLSIDKVSSYQLVASAGTYTSATSATFNVTGETQLLFVAQPTDVVSARSISPSVKVAIADASGTTVTSATQAVTLGILTGSGKTGASIFGTKTVDAVAGIATFTDVRIDSAGTGYKLLAVATGTTLTSVNSAAFAVNPGAPKQLVFQVQPQATLANATFPSAVKVFVADSVGNVVTSATNAITLSITANTGTAGAVLNGTVTVNAVAGVATFTGVSVDRAGTNYTLNAAAATLNSAVSAPFTTSIGAASKILFQVPPSNAFVNAAIAPAVKVMVTDAAGNLVSTGTNTITLAINSSPAGAVLGGTLTQTAVGGVATFSNLSLNVSGPYTLVASTTGLTTNSIVSAGFSITGVATKLVYTVQPTTAVPNGVFTVSVAVTDNNGTTINTATNPIALTLTGGTAGAVLGGTTTVSAVAGIATFNVKIDKPGNGYSLTAATTGLTSALGNAFNVVVGSPTKLIFTQNPGSTTGGTPFAPTIQVALVDSVNNVVTTASNTISLSVASGTGTAGAAIIGTTSAVASNGVASFPNIAVDKAGTAYQLFASTGTGQSGTSTTFNVTVGPSAKLTYLVPPVSTTSATAIPTVQVAVTDLGGNTVTSATDAITISVSGPGTLSGTKTANAVAGVVSFSGLSIDVASSYTMLASASGLASATSAAFPITVGSASALSFVTSQASITAGQNSFWSVQITDAGGNRITSATNPVTISVSGGTAGATFTGTKTVNAVGGLASFGDLKIDKTGGGYIFSATASGLATAASGAFTVVVGPATRLAFVTNPTNSSGGAPFSPTVQVAVVDAAGNVVTSAANFITMTVGSGGTAGATVTGTTSASASSGVASFPNLAVDKAGTGYQLQASSSGLTAGTSTSFDVAVGPSAKLVYLVAPSASTGGVPWTPAVQVAVADLGGNTVTSATDAITISIPAGTATLGGTKTVSAVAGVASFPGLNIDLIGNYTLNATATGLAQVTSANVPITVGPAVGLAFFSSPTTMTAAQNASWNAQIVDAGGNRVTSATNSVTIGLVPGTGTSGAVLSGSSLTIAATSGQVSFPVQIDKVGTGYQLRVTSTGLNAGTSVGFPVTPGTVSQIVFGVVPKSTFVNAPLNPDTAVTVRTLDAGGNPVSTSDGFQIILVAGPGGASISGIGFTAVAGVATVPASVFPNVPGATWQIKAVDNSRGISVTGPVFSVAAFDAPSKIGIVTQPTAMQYLIAPVTPPVFAVQDKYNNTVTTSTDSIAVSLSTNPGSATLGGAGTRAVAGIATLSSLTLDQPGTGFVLTPRDVTTPSLGAVPTNAFNASTPGVVASASIASLIEVGSNLYWVDGVGAGIRRVSDIGGTVTVLASSLSNAGQLVSDGTNLYWSETGSGGVGQGKISKMAIGGGAITTVASGFTSLNNFGLLSDGVNLYFVAQQTSGSNYAIKKVPTTGGTATDFVTVGTGQPAFTLSGGTLYFSDPSTNSIKSISTAGGTITTVSTGAVASVNAHSMLVAGSNLFFGDSPGNLQSAPLTGGTNTIRVAATGCGAKTDLATDGTSLFFEDSCVGTRKMNLSSFAVAAASVNETSTTAGLVLDNQSIFVFSSSFILKAPK